MGIRLKLLLMFVASFALTGAASLYVLQARLHQQFQTLERAELTATLARVTAVSETIPQTLLGLTVDWAHWTDMYRFVQRPVALAAWIENNVDEETVKNGDISLYELLSPTGGLTDRKFNRMRPSMARVLCLETRSPKAV